MKPAWGKDLRRTHFFLTSYLSFAHSMHNLHNGPESHEFVAPFFRTLFS